MEHFKLVIDKPITSLLQGNSGKKMKRYYLTANLFYGGGIHWTTKSEICDYCKEYIKKHIRANGLDKYKGMPNSKVKITIFTNRKVNSNTNLDLDGRGFFWGKLFNDLIQPTRKMKTGRKISYIEGMNFIENDNMYWISNIEYDYQKGEDKLVFEILPRE
jgi:hypothetical protein